MWSLHESLKRQIANSPCPVKKGPYVTPHSKCRYFHAELSPTVPQFGLLDPGGSSRLEYHRIIHYKRGFYALSRLWVRELRFSLHL